MKASAALEKYYVLPCCLLLLNLCNEIIAYKARLIGDDLLRTLVIMGMVLGGASLVAFAVAPGFVWTVQALRRTSRSAGGGVGEVAFLFALGGVIFWLYYRNYILGTASILPPAWRNPLIHP
jgi:drug/metabolite transporter (DMT)-like permease